MRTTLDLDERVIAAARSKARHERISLGRAVSELALAGLTPQRSPRIINGIIQAKSVPGRVITDEMVYELLNEE